MPSHPRRQRIPILGTIRRQRCGNRHEILVASGLGLCRLSRPQTVPHLLVCARRHERRKRHRPSPALFSQRHSLVGTPHRRRRQQRQSRLLWQRPRPHCRSSRRKHSRLLQHRLSQQQHQHHPKTAPRVPGPILLRTHPIIRRQQTLGQRRTLPPQWQIHSRRTPTRPAIEIVN